jgi:glycosyltransferase involved in cell wall biosynthesis
MSFPVMWYSNAPFVGSGYGQQTRLTVKAMLADGYRAAIAANFGLNGSKIEWDGVTVYPGGMDVWANDVIGLHAADWFRGERGWVIALADAWVLQGPGWEQHRTACWVPVDHSPVPPKVTDFFIRTGAVPIAMSLFGQQELRRIGLDALYAPHGIDTQVFRRVDEFQGKTPRELFGIPDDAFVVGMNAANKGTYKIRKGFPQAFVAFSVFARRHPDAVLFVHAEKFGHAEGVDLLRLAKVCGIPDGQIRFTDQYAYRLGLPDTVIAAMYSAFDVLLAPSMGEGFGIPVIEAQACGVPVIVSDFSAQPELVGSGWAVGGAPDWDEGQAAWLHLPDYGQIIDALEAAYDGDGRPELARAKAEEYDIGRTWAEHWRPIMADLGQRLELPEALAASPVDLGAL